MPLALMFLGCWLWWPLGLAFLALFFFGRWMLWPLGFLALDVRRRAHGASAAGGDGIPIAGGPKMVVRADSDAEITGGPVTSQPATSGPGNPKAAAGRPRVFHDTCGCDRVHAGHAGVP